MPRLRRRPHPLSRAPLGLLRLMRLAIGAWSSSPDGLDAARVQYLEHRDELLDHYPPDEGGPAAFWAFEPGVPASLRTEPAGREAWLRRVRRSTPHPLQES